MTTLTRQQQGLKTQKGVRNIQRTRLYYSALGVRCVCDPTRVSSQAGLLEIRHVIWANLLKDGKITVVELIYDGYELI